MVGNIGAMAVQLFPFTSHHLGLLPVVIDVTNELMFAGFVETPFTYVAFIVLTTGKILSVSYTQGSLVKLAIVSKLLTHQT